MKIHGLVLVIGVMFCPIAALMAFLITYNEYLRHFPNRKIPFKMALEAAVAAFILFGVLLTVVTIFLGRL